MPSRSGAFRSRALPSQTFGLTIRELMEPFSHSRQQQVIL